MQYFRALLDEGDKDTISSNFEEGGQIAQIRKIRKHKILMTSLCPKDCVKL